MKINSNRGKICYICQMYNYIIYNLWLVYHEVLVLFRALFLYISFSLLEVSLTYFLFLIQVRFSINSLGTIISLENMKFVSLLII